MKILSIEYIETYKPNCSCGTGYSEPDIYRIVCDSNLYENDIWHADSNEKKIWIDTWYVSGDDNIKKIFIKEINEQIGNVENLEEAFNMYLNSKTSKNKI